MIPSAVTAPAATPGTGLPVLAARFLRLAFFNLLLVALLGVVMRYKIFAPLPWLNMKHTLHGHSHFAFAGWVSLALMAALFRELQALGADFPLKTVRNVLLAQTASAYGMLLAFPLQGYGPVSIAFSTASIAVSWWFTAVVARRLTHPVIHPAVRDALAAALGFNVLSAAGTASLVYFMVTRATDQTLYFGSVYFYLHFQYNGWFLFAVMALFLGRSAPDTAARLQRSVRLQAAGALPGVFLSMLWMKLPFWMKAAAILAALVQAWGLVEALMVMRRDIPDLRARLREKTGLLWSLALAALSLRTLLQLLSVVPALGKYAFAYRPVVIGFLHLMLLGCITLFLIGFLQEAGVLRLNGRRAAAGMGLFLAGFTGTELVLMGQGLLYIGWIAVPHTNEALLAFAVLMAAGIGLMQPPASISLVTGSIPVKEPAE